MIERVRLLGGAALLFAAAAAHATAVKVDARSGGVVDTTAVVTEGSSFFVDILISDVADLGGFQFTLNYDPAILSATGLVSGSLFPSAFAFDLAGTGSWFFSETSTLDPVAIGTDTPIATFGFTALAAGVSGLTLTDVLLSNGDGTAALAHTQTDATVAVPLPGTAVLLGAGLLGLARRRAEARESL